MTICLKLCIWTHDVINNIKQDELFKVSFFAFDRVAGIIWHLSGFLFIILSSFFQVFFSLVFEKPDDDAHNYTFDSNKSEICPFQDTYYVYLYVAYVHINSKIKINIKEAIEL